MEENKMKLNKRKEKVGSGVPCGWSVVEKCEPTSLSEVVRPPNTDEL